jgi:4-amino-4-deoxy-L-arabinose transferase-like glycosyltransferase
VPGLALLVVAFGLSGAAQLALRSGSQATGIAAALTALAAGIAAARLAEPAPAPPAPPALPWRALRPVRPALAGLAVVALGGVLALQAADRAYGWQLAGFVVSALGWSAAWLPRPLPVPDARELAIVAALLALGLAARLPGLEQVPGGLYGDEAEFGLRALAVLEGPRPPPFSVAFDDHPTLFHWIQAAGLALAGRDVAGLRLASALAGALTVPALYLLLRRDLGRAGAAAGGVLLAFAPLPMHLTRLASNNAWVGLCSVAALAAAYAALRSGRALAAVAAGSLTGLCFYFGNKAVGLPPLLALALLALAAGRAVPVGRQHRLGVLALATALLVFLPELVHYLRNDWYGPLLRHPLARMVELGAPGAHGAAATLADQAGRALLSFVFLADRSPFSVRPGFPILAAAEGAVFLVGVALAVGRPRRPIAGVLLGWLAVALATNALDQRPPQANHLIGAAALPSAFAALALHDFAAGFARAVARPRLASLVSLGLAAAVAAQSASAYLGDGRRWALAEVTELGRAMGELAPTHHLVLVTPRMSWDQNSSFKFLAPGVRAQDKLVELDPAAAWFEPSGRDVAFLVMGQKAALLPAIRERYPGGVLEERRGPAGELRAAVYRVPAAEVERVARALSARAARPGSR